MYLINTWNVEQIKLITHVFSCDVDQCTSSGIVAFFFENFFYLNFVCFGAISLGSDPNPSLLPMVLMVGVLTTCSTFAFVAKLSFHIKLIILTVSCLHAICQSINYVLFTLVLHVGPVSCKVFP
jgi:hypothetical protein